jgi:hypothetical protein
MSVNDFNLAKVVSDIVTPPPSHFHLHDVGRLVGAFNFLRANHHNTKFTDVTDDSYWMPTSGQCHTAKDRQGVIHTDD